MKRTLPAWIVLVVCVILTSAAQAQSAATLCLGGGSTAAVAAVTPDGASPSFGEAVFGSAARGVVYLQGGGCTVTDTCPDSSTISCTGLTSCSTTSAFCSDQGSTCPGQASNVPSVTCDGAVRATCTCPAVCFGCGATCTTNANCGTSVCSCGGGRCVSGHCTCRF